MFFDCSPNKSLVQLLYQITPLSHLIQDPVSQSPSRRLASKAQQSNLPLPQQQVFRGTQPQKNEVKNSLCQRSVVKNLPQTSTSLVLGLYWKGPKVPSLSPSNFLFNQKLGSQFFATEQENVWKCDFAQVHLPSLLLFFLSLLFFLVIIKGYYF